MCYNTTMTKAINGTPLPLPVDHDELIDHARIAATHLDHGKEFFNLGIEAVVLTDAAIYTSEVSEVANFFHLIGKAVMLPFLIFSLILGPIQLGTNGYQHETTGKIHTQLQKGSLEERLTWLESRFFSLSDTEKGKIQEYVSTHLAHLSSDQQDEEVEHIEEAGRKIKLATLGRRISPGMTEQLTSELEKAFTDLSSEDPITQKIGEERAELLLSSVSDQLKTQMRINKLAMGSVIPPLVYIGLFLFGLGGVALGLVLNGIGMLGMAAEHFYTKHVFEEGGDEYAEKITIFNEALSHANK